MESNRVRIFQNGSKFGMSIDDADVRGVRFVEFRTSIEEAPVVLVEFFSQDVEIELDLEDESDDNTEID